MKDTEILSQTPIATLLSRTGEKMFFPDNGIMKQVEESSHAKIKATAGIASEAGVPYMLDAMRKLIDPSISEDDSVNYAPSTGIKPLQKIWLQEICRKNPSIHKECITMPTVVSGITHGISQILELFVDESDIVISPSFFWENYRLIIETRLGGIIKTFPLFTENAVHGSFHIEAFRSCVREYVQTAPKKFILILNFPNNPTGYTVTTKEALQICKIIQEEVAEKNIPCLCIIDDAYFGTTYEEECYKESLFTLFATAGENILAVKIDGATKELFSWGLRVGFVTFGYTKMNEGIQDALTNKLKGMIRSSVTNGSKISQTLTYRALSSPQFHENAKSLLEKLRQKYLAVKHTLHTLYEKYPQSPLQQLPCNSGYFVSFLCTHIEAQDLRLALLHKEDIAVISIDNILRVTFSAATPHTIPIIMEKIFFHAQAFVQKKQ